MNQSNIISILVVSNIEWSTENAFGNTISNWFEGLDGVKFASVYTRSSMPHNSICRDYFTIESLDLIKNFYRPQNIGRSFSGDFSEVVEASKSARNEKKIIDIIHKSNTKVFHVLDSLVFNTGIWNNDGFIRFIDAFHPDVVFSFVSGSPKTTLLVKTILDHIPKSKYVAFIADDVLETSDRRKKKNIAEIIQRADLLYGATPLLCQKYGLIYNTEIKPLTKGCHIEDSIPIDISNESKNITITYAGNLYYGRDETLCKLSHAIEWYNKNHSKQIVLKVFSGSPIPQKMQDTFNENSSSQFLGKRTYDEIKKELKRSEIVLHVESFDPRWRKIVKYSFSTKIIDCLESGSVLLMIGPNDLASIQAARDIEGSFTIMEESKITDGLCEIAKADLQTNAKRIRQSAILKYDIANIQKGIKKDIKSVLEK